MADTSGKNLSTIEIPYEIFLDIVQNLGHAFNDEDVDYQSEEVEEGFRAISNDIWGFIDERGIRESVINSLEARNVIRD